MSPPTEPMPPLQIPAAGPEEATAAAQDGMPLRPAVSRSRTMTTTAEIDSTITKPGSVKINVTGAFIVDPEMATPKNGRGSPTTQHETSDIRLPNHTAVVSHIAVDVRFSSLCFSAALPLLTFPPYQIGGSLIKLVYFSREVDQTDPGGRLTFQIFETDRIDDCVEYMRDLRDRQITLNGSRPGDLAVMATGGGAYKFYDKIRDALGVDVSREDEMECLIIGTSFTLLPNRTSYSIVLVLTYLPRPRLLHHRNPPRSLYLLRDRPHALCRPPRGHLPVPARQHWLRRLHAQSHRPAHL